jgi:hypothetical protein
MVEALFGTTLPEMIVSREIFAGKIFAGKTFAEATFLREVFLRPNLVAYRLVEINFSISAAANFFATIVCSLWPRL